ncbi:pyridoxal-phosphate dependent enzyme [Pseudoflavonifractor sp. AF19-9AC]|uniref:pyridoxal-phosphate dependent enzyme n=1 Tax=Pseudoflavonifractor sp. AF19-9AC TaxID=2292244 RepID=UPI000E4D3801|nr:pyridoxal-phosphate dependent enzyme [Pseudoflavonifractor sp. AF19-9AC]RHR10781.1 pyridoxal-phosphate dependent enzyme [Pseudoflavonifractor sp. AF19-9AC]
MTEKELEAALSAFPRRQLCGFATPVQRLYRLEEEQKTGPVFIKRDDLNGVGPGGNKVRPLEYLLGEALDRGCDVVIASGQENSNLCSIAASACCRLGVSCILVHNNPKPEHLAGNMLLNHLSGVEEHYIGSIPEQERDRYVEELADRLRREGRKPYVVENGATSVHGAIGYFHLPLELVREKTEVPIRDLFVPGGNGGLAAGVVFGTALLGGPFHVHVITVENTKKTLEAILDKLFQGLKEYTGLVPDVPVDSVMTIHEAYRGEGWGIPTKESEEMIRRLAQREGIFLERIYTAKTAWGMCDLLSRGLARREGACLVHSGGFASLFYQYT